MTDTGRVLLEAAGVRKSYHDGRKETVVLKGVDLRVPEGGFIAVIGPSGAGKSTLLHILGGLDAPTQGGVVFEGESLYGMNENDLAAVRNRRIGFVFQFYHLLGEFTVLENVMLPAMAAASAGAAAPGESSRGRAGGALLRLRSAYDESLRARAADLLTRAGLGERLEHFPSQLSGGEKQRVAIVRSLINEPAVLLCDEPTGNLDSKTGAEIVALLRQFHKEKRAAIVLVTHNLELAGRTDRTYHLRDGILVH